VLVRTTGGGEFQGTLLRAGTDRLELVGAEGLIELIHREAIVSIEPIVLRRRDQDERDLYFRDAASNRLIVMPSAFGMDPGEFHITAQEIVIVTMSYGFSRNLSVWGGISIPGALGNIRYSIALGEDAALSLGSFAGMTWMEPIGLALPYSIVSFGSPDRNFTAGLALPFIISSNDPFLVAGILAALGGKAIVSRTASIVTETWIFYSSDNGRWSRFDVAAFPAVAFRIAGGRFSWDIGAVLPLSLYQAKDGFRIGGSIGGTLIPIPLLSLTYRLQ
jgi:hypothetical protein